MSSSSSSSSAAAGAASPNSANRNRPDLSPAPSSASSSSSSTINFSELVWTEKDCIGMGGGCKVYKVFHQPSSTYYALKTHNGVSVVDQISREIEVLQNVDHPNVIKFLDYMKYDGGDIKLLLEFIDNGSLHGQHFPDEASLSAITRQILSGLDYLRSLNIVHLDIKPDNLLFNSQRVVKIADFGLSQVLEESMETCISCDGTDIYMSPERIDDVHLKQGLRKAYAADIWSLGLTIWELYLGRYPLGDALEGDMAAVKSAICKSLPPQLPSTASEDLRDFIDRCLQMDPAKRFTAADLLKHAFILKHKSSGITPQTH